MGDAERDFSHPGGVAGTDAEEVWMFTVASVILFIYASFVRNKFLLLPKGSLLVSGLATRYNLVAQFVGATSLLKS